MGPFVLPVMMSHVLVITVLMKRGISSSKPRGGSLSINVGRDVPTLRVSFSQKFSGTGAHFCRLPPGPVYIFASFSGTDAPDIYLLAARFSDMPKYPPTL